MNDLVLFAAIALGLIGVACFVAGLLGYVKAEVIWFPPDPDPVDEQFATLPDLGPWLPAADDRWLFIGWCPPDLEPSHVDQMLADIEQYLKERSQ